MTQRRFSIVNSKQKQLDNEVIVTLCDNQEQLVLVRKGVKDKSKEHLWATNLAIHKMENSLGTALEYNCNQFLS